MMEQKVEEGILTKKSKKPSKIPKLIKSRPKRHSNEVFKINTSYMKRESVRNQFQQECSKLVKSFHINERFITELDYDDETGQDENYKSAQAGQRKLGQQREKLNFVHQVKKIIYETLNVRQLEELISNTIKKFFCELDKRKQLSIKLRKLNYQTPKKLNLSMKEQKMYEEMYESLECSFDVFMKKVQVAISTFYKVRLYRYLEYENISAQNMMVDCYCNREVHRIQLSDTVKKDLDVVRSLQRRITFLMGDEVTRNIEDVKKVLAKQKVISKELTELNCKLKFACKRYDRHNRAVRQLKKSQKMFKHTREAVRSVQQVYITPLLELAEMGKSELLKQLNDLENSNERNDGDKLEASMHWIAKKLNGIVEQTNILFSNERFQDCLILRTLFEKYKIRMQLKIKKMRLIEKTLGRLLITAKNVQDFFDEVNYGDSSYLEARISLLREDINSPPPQKRERNTFEEKENSSDSEENISKCVFTSNYFEEAFEFLTEPLATEENDPIQKWYRFEKKADK